MSGQALDLSRIPATWQVVPLFFVGDESEVPNSDLREQNLLSLSYGRIIRKDIQASEGLLPASFETYQIVEPGYTVLRLTDLQNDQRSLRTGYVTERGIITSAYVALRPRPNVDPRFLSYLLFAYDVNKAFYALGGGMRQSMKFADLRRLPVALPPLEEQRRIADFLDDQTTRIDRIVTARQQQIELLEEGLVSWLSEQYQALALEWGLADLRYGLRAITQGWSPQCHDAPPGPGEWGVLKAGCVNGGVFRANDLKTLPEETPPRTEYLLNEGDLLVNRASGSLDLIGSCAVANAVHPRSLFSDKLYRLETNGRWEPAFIAALWRAQQVREHIRTRVSGAEGMANSLPSSLLREARLPDARSGAQSQWLRENVDRSRHISETVKLVDSSIQKTQELKRSLISAAVSGEFDVSSADGSRVVA